MGVRGRGWGAYVDNSGVVWAMRVDNDLALQPQRGWIGGDPALQAPLPRGWLPRAAVGVEPSGRLQRATVARLDADLWTGASVEFDVEATDGTIVTCTVIRLLSERAFYGTT